MLVIEEKMSGYGRPWGKFGRFIIKPIKSNLLVTVPV